MKKLIIAFILISPIFMLAGCTYDTVGVDRVVYDPGYSNDYVYSVSYYNNRPYWGNNYYYPNSNYFWDTDGYWGYWGGGYYNGY